MKTIKKLTRHYTKDGTFISHQDTMCLSKDVEKLETITDELLKRLCKTNEALRYLVDEGLLSESLAEEIIKTNIEAIKKATE